MPRWIWSWSDPDNWGQCKQTYATRDEAITAAFAVRGAYCKPYVTNRLYTTAAPGDNDKILLAIECGYNLDAITSMLAGKGNDHG